MIAEEIYNLFKQELDGEEFENNEDAQRAMNVAYRKILAERDWEILKKDTNLLAGTTSLASITDLDRVLNIHATKGVANDEVKLEKANKSQRFDYEGEKKDYYIDLISNSIEWIYADVWTDYNLIVDYKYRPDDLDLDDSSAEPVFPEDYQPRIAYEMVLAYKRGDESFDGYREVEAKNDELKGLMVDWNESLVQY